MAASYGEEPGNRNYVSSSVLTIRVCNTGPGECADVALIRSRQIRPDRGAVVQPWAQAHGMPAAGNQSPGRATSSSTCECSTSPLAGLCPTADHGPWACAHGYTP